MYGSTRIKSSSRRNQAWQCRRKALTRYACKWRRSRRAEELRQRRDGHCVVATPFIFGINGVGRGGQATLLVTGGSGQRIRHLQHRGRWAATHPAFWFQGLPQQVVFRCEGAPSVNRADGRSVPLKHQTCTWKVSVLAPRRQMGIQIAGLSLTKYMI